MSKVLINKLRRAATVCEDWDIAHLEPPVHNWATLMDEAADLIEGLEDNEPYDPPEGKRFDWNDDTDIRTAVFEAMGAASVCWDGVEDAGVFQSQTAIEIGDELLEFLYTKLKTRV